MSAYTDSAPHDRIPKNKGVWRKARGSGEKARGFGEIITHTRTPVQAQQPKPARRTSSQEPGDVLRVGTRVDGRAAFCDLGCCRGARPGGPVGRNVSMARKGVHVCGVKNALRTA